VRGVSQPEVRWSDEVLDALVASALLGYLAIAHHGRGRGAWVAQQPPALWTEAVQAAARGLHVKALAGDALQAAIETACRQVLQRLYPDSVVWRND
jgi:hypothetical protein